MEENTKKYSIPPTTPHNVLLYLQSMNKRLPIYCKRVLAESRVSPPAIRTTETEVVAKLKELGIGMEEIRKAGFFQTHKKMGFVKNVGGGGGEEFEGFVLSFEKGREIELFKETRMGEEKTGNRIVLSATGMACATHFHNTYLYLLDSKEYIENLYKHETTTGITKEKATAGISKELNNYIDEVIELYMASSLKENTCMERVIGEYRGTELKIKRNEGIAYAVRSGGDRNFLNETDKNEMKKDEINKNEEADDSIGMVGNADKIECIFKETPLEQVNEHNYVSVVKKVKKDNLTPNNIGAVFLSQIPLVSSVIANAIMVKYQHSMSLLIKELEKDPECLNTIQTEKDGKKRKLGSNVVKNIRLFLLGN